MPLNQPDIEKFLKQARLIEVKAHKLATAATRQREFAEAAALEFADNGEFSQATCEAMVPLSVEIARRSASLAPRQGVFRGYSWFFLPDGVQEGDSPPCEC
jgi:hypothetical protein